MSYKALYRKYRPTTFGNVLGQDHIVSTLKNIITTNKISHAYLFAGPRGTGKTSVAHVFAHEINRNAAGNVVVNDLDVIEIDAASNNGVAEIRSVIDNARYAPSESKYKVYIIDEVHMLTKGAFNALLKTLEEPPQHVVFILATTEPHKIPVTILSRTQRFNFRRIEDGVIRTQLENVLRAEDISYEQEAVRFIAKLSQGGMRDALSIADQAAAYGNGNITFAAISQVFGIISIQNQIKLLNLAYESNAKDLLLLSTQFLDAGSDVERLTSSLIDIARDFIVYKKTQDANLLEVLSIEEIEQLKVSVQYAYEVVDTFIKLLSNLRYSQVPRQSFELALLKIAQQEETEVNSKPQVEVTRAASIVADDTETSDAVKEVLSVFATSETKIPVAMGDESVQAKETEALINEEFADIKEEVEEENVEKADVKPSPSFGPMPAPATTDDEIDLIKMFSMGDKKNNVQEQEKREVPLVDDILNIFVQASKSASNKYREKLIIVSSFISHNRYASFATYLQDAKIISAGEGFILFSSEDDIVVEQIQIDKNRQDFIDFTKELFGEPINAFAITKKQFIDIKTIWADLAKNGKLPGAKDIKKMSASEKPKSDAEKFGASLFGDLFN